MQDSPEQPYNPLEKRNLAVNVVDALLARPIVPLPPPGRFLGAGVYAIYYTGPFLGYERVAERNRDGRYGLPIYVGKAIPAGGRIGGLDLGVRPSTVLYSRLRQHSRSIGQTDSLVLGDFACRYLVVDDIWIPLAENMLIEEFRPLWNIVIDGFGIHDPGRGRSAQARSAWDELHPGRAFARAREAHPRSVEELRQFIADFFTRPELAQQMTVAVLSSEDDSSVI